MVHCCVPFCKNTKGKTKGISYHEFPLKEDLKRLWLRAISRSGFEPNNLSNSSVICSVHFKESDYKLNCKKRILKAESVPTTFLNYPAYKIPKEQMPRRKIVKSIAEVQSRKRKRSQSNEEIENTSNSGSDRESRFSISNSIGVQTDEEFVSKLKELERQNTVLRCKLWRANKNSSK